MKLFLDEHEYDEVGLIKKYESLSLGVLELPVMDITAISAFYKGDSFYIASAERNILFNLEESVILWHKMENLKEDDVRFIK